MEAVGTSETLINFYQTTRRNIPEDKVIVQSGPVLATELSFPLLFQVRTSAAKQSVRQFVF
jgi:hypothetical protein